MEKLLPCPFCGSDADMFQKDSDPKWNDWVVHCSDLDCWANVRHINKADAIRKWNTRATGNDKDEQS